MTKNTYRVATVMEILSAQYYDVTLCDMVELDDEGLPKTVGGFSFTKDGVPPIEGSTVEVTGTLGTPECIIEWDQGRLKNLKYEGKTEDQRTP